MICTIDIGNTKNKFCIWKNSKAIKFGSWENEIPHNLLGCERWILSNVTEKQMEIPREMAYLSVTPKLHLPYSLAYKTPETLGADRISVVAGAIIEGFETAIIIDCGTCIKMEVLSKKVYLGGSISPGVFMRSRALKNDTGKLPFVVPKAFSSNYGASTEESILCGVIQGASAEIEMRINRIQQEIGECPVLITGGDANLLQNHILHKIFALPNLLHSGLFKLHSIND